MVPRVVVTGMGLLTSLGNDVPTTWQGLCQGQSGVDTITTFDTSRLHVHFGAELKNFDPTHYMERKEARRTDPFEQYAIVAAKQALQQAGLQVTEENADQVGVLVGSCYGGLTTFGEGYNALMTKGPARINVHCINMMTTDSAAGLISIMTGARGPNWAVASAHVSSSNAIGEAWEIIRRGDATAMITVGAEKSLHPIVMAAFYNIHALSRHNDDPQGACRPFDVTRDGCVLADGAGALILEELESARARGAAILAEIVGYGSTVDAYHITEPAPGGTGLVRAMRRALQKAHLHPEEIDHINAHGSSTPYNDRTETEAIKTLFGPHAYEIPISANKSMIGHTQGASGAVEAVIAIMTIGAQTIPPTVNLHHPDPACDLDYVPQHARQASIKTVMSNSVGFNGHNACLIFQRYKE